MKLVTSAMPPFRVYEKTNVHTKSYFRVHVLKTCHQNRQFVYLSEPPPMTLSDRVPAALQDKFNALSAATDAFCDLRLNDDYKTVIRQALAGLCRKRPSPLLKGTESAWAAGVVQAVGSTNFLFDASQTPHCKATDIHDHFGVSKSTAGAKSKAVQDALKMGPLSPEWTLPSRLESNPLVWMLQVNGYMVDARSLPLEVQEIALAKGLIPFIPGRKEAKP